MMLEEACEMAPQKKIAAWCRDGMVASRVGLRVSRIRDLDTGINDTISDEDFVLDPADWAPNALGNLHGPHWRGEEARFECGEDQGLPLGLNMILIGGALYRIQVRRDDLNRMLATVPPSTRGRPLGRGGYLQSDKPIVDQMRAGLASGQFTSPTEAARHFAEKARGGGTLDSKTARLVARYNSPE